MCSIIGVSIADVKAADIELIHRLMLEARIRGLHATGVSYVESGNIVTVKEALGADKFLELYNFADFVDGDGSLRMVAHCRYSTSDLEFNQPIANTSMALVHNGVISQELPENWESLYGLKCDTRNDTELLFKTVWLGRDPLTMWPTSSIAALELYDTGYMRAYRNGRRPLYMSAYNTYSILFASTQDIFIRAKLPSQIIRLQHDVYHTVDLKGYVTINLPPYPVTKELQP